MKKIKTNSYFVTICKSKNKIFIQRRKRKGLHAYPRIFTLKEINKYLNYTDIKYPKILKNGLKFVHEEYIESTQDIKTISNIEIIDNVINVICNLNTIEVKNKKITWKNNSEYFKYCIKNLKEVLISKNPDKLNNYLIRLDNLYKDLDDNRKLCFIHGDLHTKNMIISKDGFYLIDWELATFGDLAYELATHFILMGYNENEKNIFLDKLVKVLKLDFNKLIDDIDAYTEFELYRRKVLKENYFNSKEENYGSF